MNKKWKVESVKYNKLNHSYFYKYTFCQFISYTFLNIYLI